MTKTMETPQPNNPQKTSFWRSKKLKALFVIIIALIIGFFGLKIYFRLTDIKLQRIENNMTVKIGESIIVRTDEEDICVPEDGAPGGCPVGAKTSDYYDISFVDKRSSICHKNNYTIITPKKEGVVDIVFFYACSGEIVDKYILKIIR
ncbi:MAG: hypothetical protein V1845_00120 [bacterium]